MNPLDPKTMTVLQSALLATTEEMGATLIHTALSANIKERRDCCTAIFTTTGDLVARAEHTSLHPGPGSDLIKQVLQRFPLSDLVPGDVVIVNDPYISGWHPCDIYIVAPVYAGNTPLAILAGLARHMDVGGAVPGGMSTTATEIYQEGLRIPPLKISRAGSLNHDLIDMLAHNVRTGDEFLGDLKAQLAANQVGMSKLQSLARRTGTETMRQYMEEMINSTEQRLKTAIAAIPAGIYRHTGFLQGDGIAGDQVVITAAVEITPDGIRVDFTGTAPQVRGPYNATRDLTRACVYSAIKSILEPNQPANEGLVRLVQVVTPPGTLVNPHFPAPVAHAGINTAWRITGVVLGALSRALASRAVVTKCAGAGSIIIGGRDARGRYYSHVETHGAGPGFKYDPEDIHTVPVHILNTRGTPVEVMEKNYPLLVKRHALSPGLDTPDLLRGSTGMVREITVLEQAVITVSMETGSSKPGLNWHCYIKTPAGIREPMPVKFTREVPAGTTLEVVIGGAK